METLNEHRERTTARRRSRAWIYYAVLAVLCLIIACTSNWHALLGFFACSLYALYLYRGGRYAFWTW